MQFQTLLAIVAMAFVAATPVKAITDVDILNFALNLECLEAEFYSWAAYGKSIGKLLGGGPASTGGKKALLSPEIQKIAESIATDEIAHVAFLRAALGKAAVACPKMDIGATFAGAADLAIGAKLSPAFSPYGDDIVFLHGAFIFEDVGVTAYHGAAPLVANKDYLSAAAGILAVEAYHGGVVRALLYQAKDEYVFPYGAQVHTIVDAISALRGKLSKLNGIAGEGNLESIVPTDSNAIAFARSPRQVLNIVYGGGKTKGLFFPNGLNGVIKS